MSIKEQLMNLDLKKAYEESIRLRWTENPQCHFGYDNG